MGILIEIYTISLLSCLRNWAIMAAITVLRDLINAPTAWRHASKKTGVIRFRMAISHPIAINQAVPVMAATSNAM